MRHEKLAKIIWSIVLVGLALVAISGMVMAGMSCAPSMSSATDDEKIEAVIREYYDAFNCYDIERVKAVIAKQATEHERESFLRPIAWAESVGFKCELTSIVSIQIDGDSAVVIAESKANLDSLTEQDTWHLVREYCCWKIRG